ncbi:MAG: hypothetical protein GEV11_15670 [Streptosporangiales bacterium]|nr:hypothetical protein [Streptosporangiales bacterium]
MTATELQAELAGLRRTSRAVYGAVWGVAAGVMVYGAGNVTALLTAHGVHVGIAWMLSPMVDLGLVVALVGGRALDRYGVRDRWLTVLRWTAGLMTWCLNVAGPALRGDMVGVLIHSCGPVLLLVVAEAAGSVQRSIGRRAAELDRAHAEAAREAEPEPAASPVTVREMTDLSDPRTARRSGPSKRTGASPEAGPDVSDLLEAGRAVRSEVEARGDRLTRSALIEGLRAAGHSCSTDKAGALLRLLKAEIHAGPATDAA